MMKACLLRKMSRITQVSDVANKARLEDWGLKEEDIRIEKTEGDETSVRRGFVWFFKEAACGDTLILFSSYKSLPLKLASRLHIAVSSHVKFDPSRNLAYFLSSSFNAAVSEDQFANECSILLSFSTFGLASTVSPAAAISWYGISTN